MLKVGYFPIVFREGVAFESDEKNISFSPNGYYVETIIRNNTINLTLTLYNYNAKYNPIHTRDHLHSTGKHMNRM